jgi:DNA transposition AAA+ family ATPase
LPAGTTQASQAPQAQLGWELPQAVTACPAAHALAAFAELLIVDEADRLKTPALEQLRDHYDRSRLGMILIGMPGLEKRLARYPQLYSRIGFVHEYQPLSAEELTFVLDHHWTDLGLVLSASDFTDTEAIASITRITGGNFRLVHRLFGQIARILEINGLPAHHHQRSRRNRPRIPRHRHPVIRASHATYRR